MQRVEQRQRDLNRRRLRICQFGPAILRIRLDRRLLFSERQLEADIGVHMAVGNMMRGLAHGPSAGTIRGVELSLCESFDGCAQLCRRLGNIVNEGAFLIFGKRAVVVEFADGITQVRHWILLFRSVANARAETIRVSLWRSRASTPLLSPVTR